MASNDDGTSAIRAELLELLDSTACNDFCERNVGLELLRRDSQRLCSASPTEWKRLWKRMAACLRAGDINWATVDLFVETAYILAKHPEEDSYLSDEELFEAKANNGTPPWWQSVTGTIHKAHQALSVPPSSPPIEQSIYILRETRELLEYLPRREGDELPSPKDRGYRLGVLELATHICGREHAAPLAGACQVSLPMYNATLTVISDLVIKYFNDFGGTICCFDDVKGKLRNISQLTSVRESIQHYLQLHYALPDIGVSVGRACDRWLSS